ncbi:MAG: site-specific integrase [Thermoplasmatales archaeon]
MLPVSRNNAIRSIQPNIKVKFFSEEELLEIFEFVKSKKIADPKRANYHKRYCLLLKVLLRTGARIEEIVPYVRPERSAKKGKTQATEFYFGLRPVDINLNLNTINLLTLKKKKKTYRTLPLHPDLKDTVMQYFLEFHIDTKSEYPLFPIRRQSVDEYLDKIEGSVGIKVNAHKFRHTFAVKALLDGVPINVLQKWLAHSSLAMTTVYTDVLGMNTSDFMRAIR